MGKSPELEITTNGLSLAQSLKSFPQSLNSLYHYGWLRPTTAVELSQLIISNEIYTRTLWYHGMLSQEEIKDGFDRAIAFGRFQKRRLLIGNTGEVGFGFGLRKSTDEYHMLVLRFRQGSSPLVIADHCTIYIPSNLPNIPAFTTHGRKLARFSTDLQETFNAIADFLLPRINVLIQYF